MAEPKNMPRQPDTSENRDADLYRGVGELRAGESRPQENSQPRENTQANEMVPQDGSEDQA